MLIYIHVPFCRAKCRYCAFFSLPLLKAEALRGYTATLFSEIALWGDRLGKTPVETIFFGGGTPSLLPPATVGNILTRIHKAFSVAEGAEISVEANPDSFLTLGYAYDLAATGVNRLSLGVQSLDDATLKALGRPHDARQAAMACEAARAARFSSVSLDLIWGVPGQRRRDWQRELAAACALQPDHLSCYGLTIEEGTPLADDVREGRVTLPDEKEQAAMYLDGSDYLEEHGYLQYEISNYARMGFQCRHNLGYWENQEYLGLGPGAVSTLHASRWTNPCDMAEWMRRVKNSQTAPDAEHLTPKIRLMETVMLRLRTTRGLRLKAYQQMTGHSFIQENKPLIHMLHREGLIRIRDGYLRLTRTGMLVSDTILAHLFDTLETRSDQDDDRRTMLE